MRLSSSSGRQAAVAGVAFILVDLVALLAGGPLPAIDARPSLLSSFYSQHRDRLLVQAYVRGVAMALLVVFAVTLVRALRRRSDDLGPWILGVSLGLVAAIEFVRVAVVAAMLVTLPPAPTPVWHALGLILGAVIAFPIATGTFAVLPRLRDGFPRWIAPVGAVLALAWVITGVRAVSTNHGLWGAGTAVTIAWGVWLLALCWTLWSSGGGRTDADVQ